ncbi:hypothetical protein V6N13_024618 [Hibiscus sabdariffa]
MLFSMGVSYTIKIGFGELKEDFSQIMEDLKANFADDWPSSRDGDTAKTNDRQPSVEAPARRMGSGSHADVTRNLERFDPQNVVSKDSRESTPSPKSSMGHVGFGEKPLGESWEQKSDDGIFDEQAVDSGPFEEGQIRPLGVPENGPGKIANSLDSLLGSAFSRSGNPMSCLRNKDFHSNQNQDESIEIVPDNLEGVEGVDSGFGVSKKLSCIPHLVRTSLGQKGIFRASSRRRLRRLVKDSLEDASTRREDEDSQGITDHVETKGRMEAEAVWEISNLLEISFKGGHQAVLNKVVDLEKELWRSS